WRAVSGSCRHVGDNLIFVDKKLPQDDQIAFLVSRITSLGVTLNQDELAHLPDKWRCVIEGRES
ncbi:MAG: hypothetical protein GX589_06190, partial [Deltaproteobacteria bacterium]|nr:hypothetical protein [Deltaproteobacteria bacterium]